MSPPPPEEDVGTLHRTYESGQELRKYASLFKHKINSENLPKILEALLKYRHEPPAWH